MRMPAMSGAELLARAKQIAPEATRVLLTGCGDVDTAIEAINTGQNISFSHQALPAGATHPSTQRCSTID